MLVAAHTQTHTHTPHTTCTLHCCSWAAAHCPHSPTLSSSAAGSAGAAGGCTLPTKQTQNRPNEDNYLAMISKKRRCHISGNLRLDEKRSVPDGEREEGREEKDKSSFPALGSCLLPSSAAAVKKSPTTSIQSRAVRFTPAGRDDTTDKRAG